MTIENFENASVIISDLDSIQEFMTDLINNNHFSVETLKTKKEDIVFVNRFTKVEKVKSKEVELSNKYYDLIKSLTLDYLKELRELKQKELDEL